MFTLCLENYLPPLPDPGSSAIFDLDKISTRGPRDILFTALAFLCSKLTRSDLFSLLPSHSARTARCCPSGCALAREAGRYLRRALCVPMLR